MNLYNLSITSVQLREIDVRSLERLVKQVVLNNNHLDFTLEALTTKIAGLLSIQSCNVYKIEVRILLNLLSKFGDNSIFISSTMSKGIKIDPKSVE